MTARTGQGQGRVVVVGGLPVHIRVLANEKLDGTQMTSTARFHQRCSPSFRLVLLKPRFNLKSAIIMYRILDLLLVFFNQNQNKPLLEE